MKQTDWNTYYADNPDPWPGHDEILAEESAKLTPGRFLDLGCGKGTESLYLASQGWRVTAVDFAPAGVQVLQKLADGKALDVAARVGDVTKFALLPNEDPYDLVYIGFLHLPEPERSSMFKAAATAVAPGGTFLYIGFARDNKPGIIPPSPDCLSMPDDITPHLTGLNIVRAESCFRKIPVQDRKTGQLRMIEANSLVVKAVRPE
jgi:SAM-dependent methyltransferase